MEWYLLVIQQYGYLAILAGTLVEGEVFLALGGVLAQQGKMNMWVVAAMAIVGSFVSHTVFYCLGRWRGPALIRRFPKLERRYPQAQALVQRFGAPCIFIVQYRYGMRLVTCLALGTLGMGLGSFIFWQLVSCGCWAVGLSVAGYCFGSAIEYCLSRVELFLTLGLAGGALLVWGYRRFWRAMTGPGGGAVPCLKVKPVPKAATPPG